MTLFNDDATVQCMKNRVFKNDTLLYLSGLQFMAVAVWPAAMLTAESMKGEARDLRKPGRASSAERRRRRIR